MVTKNNLTPELKKIFKYIQETLVKNYPAETIGLEYYIIAVLDNDKCTAYQIIDKIMFSKGKVSLREDLISGLEAKKIEMNEEIVPKFDEVYDKYLGNLHNNIKGKINSGHLLLEILKNNIGFRTSFSNLGVNIRLLNNTLTSMTSTSSKTKTVKRKDGIEYKIHGVTDEYIPQLPEMSGAGPSIRIVGNEKIIQSIFVAFSKFDYNNVLLVGERGVGKTAIVRQIAEKIYLGEAPKPYRDFIVVNLKEGLGRLAQHFPEIMNDAQERGCYIFFIPDVDLLIYDGSPYVDMVRHLLNNRFIRVIATTIEERYNRVDADKHFPKLFKKIRVEEKSEEETIEMIKVNRELYEAFHDVKYNDAVIKECVKLSKKFLPNAVLPQSAFEVIDEVGALVDMTREEDKILSDLNAELTSISVFKEEAASEHNETVYQIYAAEEVSVKSKIEARKKELSLGDTSIPVTLSDVHKIIETETSVPISEIKSDERDKLLNLEKNISNRVIGQNEAVSEVVKTVKRQRVGLGKPGKPSVMLFVGNSGTGKTYLSKTLAKELFGDEKSFVRIDMSEYNDKTSVNKIYGSSAGYVGYENGGILTEAVKKHSHCVLLLDEIEKAADEVHDVFLQLFDEGRLTDNKGVTVDFSNCIIIMTSNIGTKEALLRGNGVGFNKNLKMGSEIISGEINKRFKPEFVNRIDNIIMFNELTNDDLKEIVKVELCDVEKRVNAIGYKFNQEFITKASDYIFEKVKAENSSKNYGARPIVRLIRNIIENKLTDLIIVNKPDKNYEFSFEEIID